MNFPLSDSVDPGFLWRQGPTSCALMEDLCTPTGPTTLLRPGADYIHKPAVTSQKGLLQFFEGLTHVTFPPVHLYELVGGRVYEGPVILSQDGETIGRDLSIQFGVPFEQHSLLNQTLLRSLPLPGSTLVACSHGSESYYHWLLDELPRMLLPALPDVNSLLISRANQRRLEVLNLISPHFSFKYQKLFWLDDLIRHVRCERLIASSYVSSTGQPSLYVVELLQDLADRLTAGSSSSMPEKILITRNSRDGRHLEPEAPFAAMLAEEGYVAVRLEELSWLEQIQLFQGAREIAAPHGAGLANLAFCRQRPIVYEFFNSSYVHWCFWQLANLVEATYIPFSLPWDADVSHVFEAYKDPIAMISNEKFAEYRRSIFG